VQLLAAGEVIDYDGASGHIAFDAAGDISSARVTTSRVIDGVLQPTSVQDVDLVAQQEAAIFASSVFVTQLQQALKVLGYFEGDITGVYDEATTAAVGALQHDLGLPETGQFDEATDAAMRERLGAGVATFGTSVSQLQQALADRGYYAGPIDGRYSAATIEAVRAFQRDLGVPETGVVDVATLQAIYARGQLTGAASVPTVPPETYPPPPPPTEPPTTTAPKPPPTVAPPPATTTTVEETTTTVEESTTTSEVVREPTLFDVLEGDQRFTTLVAVAETAGYGRDLASTGPLTLFAPTNDAFTPDDVARLTSDPAAADALLRNLAVEGRLTAAQLVDGETLVTLGHDADLVVDAAEDPVTVSGAPVLPGPDITASNGNAIPVGALPQP
jgi:peptidoglycan hydrolase-like protein with peptidoglycan-binding domain